VISEVHLRLMTSDQVPAENKTPDSFFAGFWTERAGASAWVSRPRARAAGATAGSGGQGTLLCRPGRNRRDPANPGRNG